ncbi:hypothetical protein WA026_005242 [Henosepilachna vigintioctopunctata]|uniref:Ketosynthase family 3 (KS3) domain-containing protein n=1 Tax=Henosepilachna vigintioctopunctata TaxID=420089 RepID=A0AAW1UP42_9CUCU
MAPNSKDLLQQDEKENYHSSILDGRFLANPPPGEEICISGMAGVFPNSRNIHEFRDNLLNKIDMVDGDCRRWEPTHPEIPQRTGKIYDIEKFDAGFFGMAGVFPNSRNIHEFRDNLLNKIDMVDGDCRRWEPTHPEIPQRTGKIYDIEKFDAGFFGIHERQAHSSDPTVRIFMEKAVEAILDAGLNPAELEGTNTGVFVGSCFSESEKDWFFDNMEPQQFGITGCSRSMIPNRISYFLKLKGPSIISILLVVALSTLWKMLIER